jgi:hypothetical protein
MQNQNDNNAKEPSNSASIPHEKSAKSVLFSEDEIQDIVKGFVSAWVQGEVKILFPDREEHKYLAKERQESIDDKEALQREVNLKVEFADRIMMASSTGRATSEEQRKAISLLFNDILLYRSSGKIEGQFSTGSMNERLQRLEQGSDTTNDLVKQLVDMHRQELGM